jgi:multidrug resistance protein MdtO
MAQLADERRPPRADFWRLLTEPTPGRLAFAARLTLICALTAIVAETYKTPEIALTVYVAFFMNKDDRMSSMAITIAFMIIITIVISILLLIASPVLSDPSYRVATMALMSFLLLFLVSASKLKPIGGTVGLIMAYALDVLGSAPLGEAATRALLYAWLFVGMPAGVSAVVNLILAPSPLKVLQDELALRLRTAGKALQDDEEAISEVRKLTAEGDSELQEKLKLSAMEHTSAQEDLDALIGSTDCVVAVLSAVELMVSEPNALPPTATREQMAQRLFELAEIFELDAYPVRVEPISMEEAGTDLAPSAIKLFNAGLTRFGERRPPQPAPEKEASGFFAPDAFTNPEHVNFALKTTGATMLCYLIYSVLNWPGIHTALITCFIVSQDTIAETVQKLSLRILGCLAGAGLGLAVMLWIIPSVTSVGGLVLVVVAGVLLGAWIAVGSPQIAYAGFQLAFAYLLCILQGPGPSFDKVVARDRVLGILLGNAVSYLFATQLWPNSVAPRVDRALKTVAQKLGAMVRSPDHWGRQRLSAETNALLSWIENDIGIAQYEPGHIRPTRTWLDQRLEVIETARKLQSPLLAASETFDSRSLQNISELVQEEHSEGRGSQLSLSGQTPSAADLKGLITVRSNLFQEALRRLHQTEEHV